MGNLLEFLQQAKIEPNKLGVVYGNKTDDPSTTIELVENEHGGEERLKPKPKFQIMTLGEFFEQTKNPPECYRVVNHKKDSFITVEKYNHICEDNLSRFMTMNNIFVEDKIFLSKGKTSSGRRVKTYVLQFKPDNY